MRVASLNIFSGRSPLDPRSRPPGGPQPLGAVALSARLAAAVTALDADVLALQEVDLGQPRSALVDQAAVAAAAMGAVWLRFLPTVHGTPGEPGWLPVGPDGRPDHPGRADHHHDHAGQAGRGDPADGPRYGIALMSRLPVRAWHVLRLPAARGRYPLPVSTRPLRVLWLADEPRVAVAVELVDPRITVATTHLSFVPGTNLRQLRLVRRWLQDLPGPHLLVGDLNLPGALAGRATGWTSLLQAPTFPLPEARVQLDHALTPQSWLAPWARARTETSEVGDHLAVVVDIEPAGPGR